MKEKQQMLVDADVVVPVNGLENQIWVTTGTAFWKGHNGEHFVELKNLSGVRSFGDVMDHIVSDDELNRLNVRPWGSE